MKIGVDASCLKEKESLAHEARPVLIRVEGALDLFNESQYAPSSATKLFANTHSLSLILIPSAHWLNHTQSNSSLHIRLNID